MNLTQAALRRPMTVFMIYTCLGVIGVLASQLLPLEYLPDIEFPGVMVEVRYHNASPEDVERRITRPVEEILATMSGIKRMRSESRENGSTVMLFFKWGQDIATKGVEATNKVDSIRHRLPPDIERIIVRKWAANNMPMMSLRISSERDLSSAHDSLDRHLKRRIERLAGVSKVELYGVSQPEIRIDLSSQHVSAHGIDLNQLRQQLMASNFSLSAGRITDQNQRFFVHLQGEFNSLEDIKQLLINERGLRLQDIAEIHYSEPELGIGRHLNQRHAIGLNVYQATGANLVAVADSVLQEIEAISQLPQMTGINLYMVDNQGEGVRNSLVQLLRSGTIGALLSVLVLYFFLRHLAITLIVTLAVPFSILVTLAALYFLGFSLNILTLMGLMLSVGMLVDNAVVVTENIFRHRQQPPSLSPESPSQVTQSTLLGVREVGVAVLAGTLTSIIVFFPNIIGDQIQVTLFLSHVAITISIAMLASLIIALTLIPLLTTQIKTNPIDINHQPLAGFTQAYTRLLAWTLCYRRITVLIILAIIGSVLIPISVIKLDMFPEDETRRLFLRYNLNDQYTLDKVEAAVNTIETYLFANQTTFEIESVYSFYMPDNAGSIIMLSATGQAMQATSAIKAAIMAQLPKLAIGQPSFDSVRLGGATELTLQIVGESQSRLTTLANDIAQVLRYQPGIKETQVDNGPIQREIQINIHRERVRQLGLSSEAVAQTITTAMRGQKLRPYRGPNGEVILQLQFQASDRADLNQLLQIPIQTPSGQSISLASVAQWQIVEVPGQITRENRMTTVSIKISLANITVPQAQTTIKALMQQMALPAGYDWRFGQAFANEDESSRIMLVNLLLAVALIYLVIAALFESLLLPLSILSAILFSIIGVVWFFFLTGTTLSIMAHIGILVLMGIVVNNGIVLIDHVNQLRWSGMTRYDALLQGAQDRLRPILMTVGTTVLGLIPLAIGAAQIGGNGPPYYPMARAIIGGLVFSTLVSLIALPTLYTLLDDLQRWARRVYQEAAKPKLS